MGFNSGFKGLTVQGEVEGYDATNWLHVVRKPTQILTLSCGHTTAGHNRV